MFVSVDRFSMNLLRYVIMPKNRTKSFLLCDAGIFLIAFIFASSGIRPSLVNTWPKNFTESLHRFNLLLLILQPCFFNLTSNSSKFLLWSFVASSILSPHPYTRMSSAKTSMPLRPSVTSCIFCEKIEAGNIPNGNLIHLYLPNGVQKVVSLLLSSDNWICQNPFFASIVENTRARPISGRISSKVIN